MGMAQSNAFRNESTAFALASVVSVILKQPSATISTTHDAPARASQPLEGIQTLLGYIHLYMYIGNIQPEHRISDSRFQSSKAARPLVQRSTECSLREPRGNKKRAQGN